MPSIVPMSFFAPDTAANPSGDTYEITDKLNRTIVGQPDAFNASNVYTKGQRCIYNNVMYKANTDLAAGTAWNTENWTATTIDDEINEINSVLPTYESITISMTFAAWLGGVYYADGTITLSKPVTRPETVHATSTNNQHWIASASATEGSTSVSIRACTARGTAGNYNVPLNISYI